MKTEDTALVIIDVQDKLTSVMHGKAELVGNLVRLVQGAQALKIPIVWLEQIPEKMGPTIPELKELLAGLTPISKKCFSCAASSEFTDSLSRLKRKHVILAGIETHVCVYQTARDLQAKGYAVEVVSDAVSSRTEHNWRIGLRRAEAAGARITSVEMALFELLGTSEHPAFRDMLKIVK